MAADSLADRRRERQMHEVFGFGAYVLRDQVIARAAAASRSYLGGLYPPAAPGIIRWMESVSSSRLALAPFGYEPDDSDLVSKVVNWTRRIAIVPAAGNAFTGVTFGQCGRYPTTKWPKGERTAEAVKRNAQFALFDVPGRPAADRPVATWMLLHHAAPGEVRAELALPGTMNARGYITSWQQRFILPALGNEDGPIDVPFDENGDGDEGIDIPVEPR